MYFREDFGDWKPLSNIPISKIFPTRRRPCKSKSLERHQQHRITQKNLLVTKALVKRNLMLIKIGKNL